MRSRHATPRQAGPVCILPARGGSKRLPRKNILPLLGKPMIGWVIEAALNSGVFSRVYVTTEDDEIADVSRKFGAEVPYKRPAELAADNVTAAAPVIHLVEYLRRRSARIDSVCVADPSSPLVTLEDFRESWRTFVETGATVLHGVGHFEHPPQRALLIDNGILKPLLGMDAVRKQSQELAPAYFLMGSPLFAKTDHLISTRSYYADRMAAYVLPAERAVDVDTTQHLAYAEFLMKRRLKTGRTLL